MGRPKKEQQKEVENVQETTQDAIEQGTPFDEKMESPFGEEEPITDVEFEDPEDISGDAFELIDALELEEESLDILEPTQEDLPSLDEIKAKERALRKR